jgi:histidine triad (HIT) family protein
MFITINLKDDPEIPCYKIYEDDKTIAFLDIHPVQPGMTLVVTKAQAETFLDLSEEDAEALWKTVRKVGAKMKQAFPGKKRIGVQIEGLDVPHVHVKIFPIDTGEEFRSSPDMSADPDQEALAMMAKKLALN